MVDELFRKAYFADVYYVPTTSDIRCKNCDSRLKVYYCGESLYAVKCGYCETITLVRAKNSYEAAKYVGYDKDSELRLMLQQSPSLLPCIKTFIQEVDK